ncbi:hypothetical protein PMAYCL1PPCAC_30457, partial [Pristionchus mayeri]
GCSVHTFMGARGAPFEWWRGMPEKRLFGTEITDEGLSVARTALLSKYPHRELPFSPKMTPRYRTSSLFPLSITQSRSPRVSVNSSADSPL